MVISLCCFFYLSKLLFLGFVQFNDDFVRGHINSKNRDLSLLTDIKALIISHSSGRFFPEYICRSIVV